MSVTFVVDHGVHDGASDDDDHDLDRDDQNCEPVTLNVGAHLCALSPHIGLRDRSANWLSEAGLMIDRKSYPGSCRVSDTGRLPRLRDLP